MIQVYYGDGKGKTSAAVGAAVRAAGAGLRVLFFSFFKNGDSSECAVLRTIPGVTFAVPDESYVLFERPDDAKTQRLRTSLERLIRRAETEAWDVLVLDEALDAFALHLLGESAVLALAPKGEIILTGHRLPAEVEARADYITRFASERHPYESGVAARRGIEF